MTHFPKSTILLTLFYPITNLSAYPMYYPITNQYSIPCTPMPYTLHPYAQDPAPLCPIPCCLPCTPMPYILHPYALYPAASPAPLQLPPL